MEDMTEESLEKRHINGPMGFGVKCCIYSWLSESIPLNSHIELVDIYQFLPLTIPVLIQLGS